MSIAEAVLAYIKLRQERHGHARDKRHPGYALNHMHAAPDGAWLVCLGSSPINMALPTALARSPYSAENREEPFLALACRSWRETKADGIIGKLPRRRRRDTGIVEQRSETGPNYGGAKIGSGGGRPPRLCRQRLMLAEATINTGLAPASADFNYG